MNDENRDEIQIDEYIIEPKILGRGASGTVKVAHLAIEREKKFAVKIIPIKNIDNYTLSRLQQEIKIQKSLNHNSILKLYEIRKTHNNFYFFTELCKNNLREAYLIPKITLSKEEIVRHFGSLIDGIEYMHNKRIVHRDLKPLNILVDMQGNWKICDFGIAKILEEDKPNTRVGTPLYFPFEILKGMDYTSKFDIW